MQNWQLLLLGLAVLTRGLNSQDVDPTDPEYPDDPFATAEYPGDVPTAYNNGVATAVNSAVQNVRVAGYCPPLIVPGSAGYAALKASFNAFVEFAAVSAPRTNDPCPRPNSANIGVTVGLHTERALQSFLPGGAQIISISVQIIGGFFFQKIIYYYGASYYYIMYNTNLRAFRRLQAAGDFPSIQARAGPDQALDVYTIVTRILETPIREGLELDSLEQLYNCTPGIENFETVRCQITAATFGNYFMISNTAADVNDDF